MADLKVTLGERIAAAVQQAAADAGVDPATWVNDQLAKVLFLQTLTGIQQRNPEPLTEQAAQQVMADQAQPARELPGLRRLMARPSPFNKRTN